MPECQCPDEAVPDDKKITAVLRIEKSGRKGKIVTVIDRLPRSESFLKELLKILKTKCGTGGTFYISPDSGTIEIQGEHRDKLRSLLEKEGIKVKGLGV